MEWVLMMRCRNLGIAAPQRFGSAGVHVESMREVIAAAMFAVSGPRSFSDTVLSRVTMKVFTPEDRYTAGYAMAANPLPEFGRIWK
jgi:hypothetical protein